MGNIDRMTLEIVRRAASAYDQGVKALAVTNLKTLFITHLHSDHTLGYPDLIFTTWVQGRRGQISAYGPPGFVTDATRKSSKKIQRTA